MKNSTTLPTCRPAEANSVEVAGGFTSPPRAATIAQGAPRPTKMLRFCDPIAFAIAMEPSPLLAAALLIIASGICPPRATNVTPKKPASRPESLTHRSVTAVTAIENHATQANEMIKAMQYIPSDAGTVLAKTNSSDFRGISPAFSTQLLHESILLETSIPAC